jgi:hypothetical protein
MLDTKNYKVVEFSWVEKRQDLLDGIATLPAQLRDQATNAIRNLDPAEPAPSTAASGHPAGQPIETAHFILGIDPQTGAIARLRNKSTGREWVSLDKPIALLTYQTLSKGDYDHFMAAYLKSTADWAFKDFGKPNIDKCGALSQEWHPSPTSIHVEETADSHRILVRLDFNDKQAADSGRAALPRKTFLELLLPKSNPEMHLQVSWFEKPATRLPEALWLTFNPVAEDPASWSLEKSGQPVSPFDVIPSGNRAMHALSTGFEYRKPDHLFAVHTLDTPVVALGNRTPLGFTTAQPDLAAGIHACLFNNAWGTNYIMWYGEDARFRFTLRA